MITKQFSVVTSVSFFCLCISSSAHAADSSSFQDWQFNTSETNAQPTIATNAAGEPSATIEVGFLASGWLSELTGFGSQTGIWDLGFQNPEDSSKGKVLLNIPDPAGARGSDYTDLTLKLVYLVDAIYTTNLTFSIPGANYGGQTVIEPLKPPFGGKWVEDRYHWRLVPSPTNISLTITGAAQGTVLDRIRVETVGSPLPPLVITSVQKSAQGLALQWMGGLPPYQIYATTNLDNIPWEAIGASLTVTNADIPLSGPAWFVKVVGSE